MLKDLKVGPGTNQLVAAVSLGQRQQRQAVANVLFVLGMDVLEVADVIDHRHAGVGNGLGGGGLRLPKFRLGFGFPAVIVRRDLHEIKREIPFVPQLRANRR